MRIEKPFYHDWKAAAIYRAFAKSFEQAGVVAAYIYNDPRRPQDGYKVAVYGEWDEETAAQLERGKYKRK